MCWQAGGWDGRDPSAVPRSCLVGGCEKGGEKWGETWPGRGTALCPAPAPCLLKGLRSCFPPAFNVLSQQLGPQPPRPSLRPFRLSLPASFSHCLCFFLVFPDVTAPAPRPSDTAAAGIRPFSWCVFFFFLKREGKLEWDSLLLFLEGFCSA